MLPRRIRLTVNIWGNDQNGRVDTSSDLVMDVSITGNNATASMSTEYSSYWFTVYDPCEIYARNLRVEILE